MKLSWWFPAPRGHGSTTLPQSRRALTRDTAVGGGVGGGGGDGEEGVGKLSARRRTDSQGAAGARCLASELAS